MEKKDIYFNIVYLMSSVFAATAEFDVTNATFFIFAKSNPPSAVPGSSTCHRHNRKWVLRPDVTCDKHDVKELLISPAVDEDVDGRIDDLKYVNHIAIN